MLWCIILTTVFTSHVIATPTLESCTIGEKWAQNFIVMECYKDAIISKGIRPIGCSPTNDIKDMIADGKTYKAKHFVYTCTKLGSSMIYQPTSCIAGDGTVFPPGNDHTEASGIVWTCKQTEQGAQLSYKQIAGCNFNGKMLKVNERTTVPISMPSEMGPLNGIVFACQQVNDKYEMRAIGCALPNKVIGKDLISDFEDKQYRCKIDGEKVSLEFIPNAICEFKGKTYNLNTFWDDEETMQQYTCGINNGTAEAFNIGCLLYSPNDNAANRQLHRITRFSISKIDGKFYRCVKGPGNSEFYQIETLTVAQSSCGVVDGVERWLLERWIVNATEYTCVWGPKVKISYCVFPEKTSIRFAPGTYRKINDTFGLSCQINGNSVIIKYLTGAEYEAAFGGESGGSFDGASGAGGSDGRTTTTTKAPITEPQPTTQKTSTSAKPPKSEEKPETTKKPKPENENCSDMGAGCKTLNAMCPHNKHKVEDKNVHKLARRALSCFNDTTDSFDYDINCEQDYLDCETSGSYETDECYRVHYYCCETQNHNYTRCKRPSRKSCQEMREAASEFVTKLCPHTCKQCDKKATLDEVNKAAEHLAGIFRKTKLN